MTTIGPTDDLTTPERPRFIYDHHSGVAVSAARARFLRPLAYLDTFEHCVPGARVRFRSNADALQIVLSFNDLNGADWVYNDPLSIYVDGALHSDFDPADLREVFSYEIPLSFGSSAYRTIELVMPYAASVDFLGVRQHPRFRLLAPLPPPPKRLLAIGDSSTQGFNASRTRTSWPFLLGAAKGWEVVNMGFGGSRVFEHFGGYSLSGLAPHAVTVLLGYNDFGSQTPLATFKGQYTTLLSRLVVDTSANIHAITPLWSPNTAAITLAQYRTAIGEVVSAIASPRITLIDGLTLATNSTASFPDNVHPNDAGSAQIAAALGAILTAAP